MAAETTSATVTELIQVAIAEARYIMSAGVNLTDPRFCTHRPATPGKGGVSFPIWDAEVFAAVNEGTDLTNTAFDTTTSTLTPGERGLMTTVTDIAQGRASEQLMVDIGRVMGHAARDLQNQEFYALFDGFSRAEGTTNTNITEAFIIAGVRRLNEGKAKGEKFMAVTPHVLADLFTLYKTSTSIVEGTIRDMMHSTGVLPPLFGVTPVLIDNLVAGSGTGEADEADSKIGMWTAEAIGYVSEWDFRIEFQRDASIRGTEIVATSSYAIGEIRDLSGVEILVDNKD